MSAQNIFYGLVTPMVYMIACLMIGYSFAINDADVCKIQIERAKKALHYESLLIDNSEPVETEVISPKEADEDR